MKRRHSAILLFAIAAMAGVSFLSYAKSDKTAVSRNLNIFNTLFKELTINYVDTLDADKTMRNAIDAMLGRIDPYTEYYPLSEQEELKSISSGEYAGIGSVISKLPDGRIVLLEPQYDAPAMRAGVHYGDILLKIDGDSITSKTSVADASAKLKGQAGTKVRLQVKRPYVDHDSLLDIEITRGTIKYNTVPYYGMIGDSIGYIKLSTYNENSARLVRDALLQLKKNPHFSGLILDLRGNGGGLLESAVQIVSLFVDKGTEVVRTRGRDSSAEKIYKTTSQPVDKHTPMAVLIDYGTASAAEITSGALQDLDRAIIIGERSYGKGLVQNARPLPYNGLLKITVARYYIPSGRLIQAIDYSHRNPDGSVARIPDSLTNVYYTRAGRPVRDGGGITPDIKAEPEEMNRMIYNVINDRWAYNFANRHANTIGHVPPADEFVIDDSLYAEFKAFIDPDKFKYDRMSEEGIKYLREAAEVEGCLNDSVEEQLKVLERLMHHNLEQDLEFNRPMLTKLLDEQLSMRYYNDADRVKRSLPTDPVVQEAVKTLKSPARVKEILSAPAKAPAKAPTKAPAKAPAKK